MHPFAQYCLGVVHAWDREIGADPAPAENLRLALAAYARSDNLTTAKN